MRSFAHANRERRWGPIVPIGALGLVLLPPLAALLATTWVLGWRLQVVQTSSMWPLYPVGTLVAVQPIDAANVETEPLGAATARMTTGTAWSMLST